MVNIVHFSCPRIMMKKIAPLGHKKISGKCNNFTVFFSTKHVYPQSYSYCTESDSYGTVTYGLHTVCMGLPYSLYGPPYKT